MLAILIGGLLTGLALGLTGGGGTLLALPIFQRLGGFDLAVATTASLAAVSLLSLIGALARVREGATQPRLGLLFAAAGMLGAPVGAYLHGQVREPVIIALFAGVVVVVAGRMWRGPIDPPLATTPRTDAVGPACRFAADGHLYLTTRCGQRLVLLGFGVGLLSGLVGVGGGFLAVPALMALTGLPLRSAVATSLLVVGLIAASGWISHQALGHGAPALVVFGFVGAGLLGLGLGTVLVRRIPAPLLRRGFALVLIVIAIANCWPLFHH